MAGESTFRTERPRDWEVAIPTWLAKRRHQQTTKRQRDKQRRRLMTKRRRDNNRHKRQHHQALQEARHPNSKAHREQPERRHKALKEVQHRDRYRREQRRGQFSGEDQERNSKVNLCPLITPTLTAYLLLSNLPNVVSKCNSLSFVPASSSSSSNNKLHRVLSKLL